MEPVEFGRYLRKLRKDKKLTVRQLDLYSGVSHSYISQIERGRRGIPSPEILSKLSKPLGIKYENLMKVAGYLNETKEETTSYVIPQSELEKFVKEQEEKYNVTLLNDPIVMSSIQQLVESIARTKIAQQKKGNQQEAPTDERQP